MTVRLGARLPDESNNGLGRLQDLLLGKPDQLLTVVAVVEVHKVVTKYDDTDDPNDVILKITGIEVVPPAAIADQAVVQDLYARCRVERTGQTDLFSGDGATTDEGYPAPTDADHEGDT